MSASSRARDDTDTDEFRAAYDETRRSYEFGILTRTLRKTAGLTQKELATRMGTTASAIARLEAGGTTDASPPYRRCWRAPPDI